MKKQFKSSLLTLLMVSFVALLAVGCGDSRDDFVATNTNNNNGVNTGNLVFRFAQAAPQAIGTVPNGTTTLRFDLHSGNPPTPENLVETRTVVFATVITLEEVSRDVKFTRVTAFGADGAPSAILDAAGIDVDAGGSAEVTFTGSENVTLDAVTFSPDPANTCVKGSSEENNVSVPLTALLSFSNGSQVNGTVNNQTTTCTFSSNIGFFDGAALNPNDEFDGANTTVLCSYTLGTTTVNDSIFFSRRAFDPFFAGGPLGIGPNSDFTGFYRVEFFDDDGTPPINVNETANTTYSFAAPAPSGLSINSSNGQMTSTGTTPNGEYFVLVEWVDLRPAASGGTGLTFSDTVRFSVGN